MSRKKLWSYSAGEYPNTVRVFERKRGGRIYVGVYDGSVKRVLKRSLGEMTREEAITYAEVEAGKLRDGLRSVQGTGLGYITMLYLTHRTPQKLNAEVRKEDERRVEFWRRRLGVHCDVTKLGRPEWEETIRLRTSGAIDARAHDIPAGNDPKTDKPYRQSVSPRTVDADLVFINAVFNWATTWTVNGRPILKSNPWGGSAAGVKRALERPKSIDVKQPVASYDRFLALRAAAERVMMQVKKTEPGAKLVTVGEAQFRNGRGPIKHWVRPSYLPEMLDLVESTGRRITAICRLRYSDFIREGRKVVAIRWTPMKRAKSTKVVPINNRARRAVERILAARPGIGDRYVFPAPRKPDQHISRFVARDWHDRAMEIAKLEPIPGGDFHPFRRKWATERKHLPLVDVMLVGGWDDERSLRNSYMKADEATTLAVVNEPRKLRSNAS